MRPLPCLSLLALTLLLGCPEPPDPSDPPDDDDTVPVDDDDTTPEGVEDALYSGDFTAPDRSVFEDPPLPENPNGDGYVLYETQEMALILNPDDRSALSAAAECLALIVACYEPGVRNYRGCFEQTTPCAGDEPWTGDDPVCCAAACDPRYIELRDAGSNEPDALVATVMATPSCMPGVDAQRGE